MIPIAVLASGRGSNFDAIQKSIEDGRLKARISLVISDQAEALVLSKAQEKGIPTLYLPFPQVCDLDPSQDTSLQYRRKVHEEQILKILAQIETDLQPRFLVLAGYLKIVTPHLIEAFRSDGGYSRIVNVHPSLLPAFPGLHSYAQAYRYGAKVAGVTVHLVEAQVDSGPICAQEAFPIEDCHSEAEVERRGLAVEHRLFPQTLNWVLLENFSIEKRANGRLSVCPN